MSKGTIMEVGDEMKTISQFMLGANNFMAIFTLQSNHKNYSATEPILL